VYYAQHKKRKFWAVQLTYKIDLDKMQHIGQILEDSEKQIQDKINLDKQIYRAEIKSQVIVSVVRLGSLALEIYALIYGNSAENVFSLMFLLFTFCCCRR
jgi:hypothetical protein